MSDSMNETEILADGIERKIWDLIDRETGYSVQEFSDMLGVPIREVQSALESLMERGLITSTPDWKYRRARRVQETGSP